MKKDLKDLKELKSHPGVLPLYGGRLRNMRKVGNDYLAYCPFHDDHDPSFRINLHDGIWMWSCFPCQGRGEKAADSIIGFVAKKDGISEGEAIKRVAAELGETWEGMKEEVDKTFRTAVTGEAKHTTLPLSKYASAELALESSLEAQAWLRDRGITMDTARKLRLGFKQNIDPSCPESAADVSDKGWIVLPCIRADQVVTVKYRSIARKAFARRAGMESWLFNAQEYDPFDTVYVTEGEFDAAIMVQAGYKAVSIPSGSAPLTAEMKDTLMKAGMVILAGDNDEVGEKAMDRLWNDLQTDTFKLVWPDGLKDANDVFIQKCGGNMDQFESLVSDLTAAAKVRPMKSMESLVEAMKNNDQVNLADAPDRLRFPWPSVDKMAIVRPGGIMSLMATNTKMGKSTFVMNFTLHNAWKHEHVILNYQCELDSHEFANMTAAYVLAKDRNHLTKEDYNLAARQLSNVRYYIGHDPSLTRVGPVLDLIEKGIRRLGATIVVLDHIHFITRNEDNPIQAQEDAMQRIKFMAAKLGVIFVVVGQPRKADKQSRGRVVHITDMKGSEAIQSDAHAIFAIHRDWIRSKDPNNPPEDDYEPKTEVHLLAARAKGDGKTYTELQFYGKLSAFRELVAEDRESKRHVLEENHAVRQTTSGSLYIQ